MDQSLIKCVIKNLNPTQPILEPEVFDKFYINTKEGLSTAEQIQKYLNLQESGLFFLSGVIGIGKTTELNFLSSLLNENDLVIYPNQISIDLDLSKIDSYELWAYLINLLNGNFDSEEEQYTPQWIAEHFHDFIHIFNGQLEKARYQYDKVIFILDDFEKISFSHFKKFITEFAPAAKEINAAFIMTVKYHMFFDLELQELRELYMSRYFIIPALNIFDKSGKKNEVNIAILTDMIKCRLGNMELNEDILHRLVIKSGGVKRIALNLVRESIISAALADQVDVKDEDVKRAISGYYNDYKRRISDHDIPKLRMIQREKDMGYEHANYLDKILVLEYGDLDKWYDVHPMVADILEDLPFDIEDILMGDDSRFGGVANGTDETNKSR